MDSQSALNQSEFERYARHLSLPQIGLPGQQRLKQSRVTIVGCGGLGAPASLYLAAAGIGTIHLIDDDTVALSNLQRQITFTENDIGLPKAEVTRKALLARNSSIQVKALQQRLYKENALSLLSGSDIVLDCCDNTETRYLINQCCRDLGIPWVYASIFQFSGQCALFTPDGPCFRCIFPEANAQLANCNDAGVIGVLPGIIGSLQTITAIKHLLSLTPAKSTELILFETLDIGLRRIDVERREDCTTCNQTNHSTSIDTQLPEETTEPMSSPIIHTDELKDLLEKDAVVLIDVREREEHAQQNLGGLNIPLRELQNAALPTDRPIVFYCQMGARSLTAQQWASGVAGFDDALSLEGGISRVLSERSID